jgi:Mg-chelatase subunit ChlD
MFGDEKGTVDWVIDMTLSVQVSMTSGAPYHIVFCLDDSGSMGGKPWDDLMLAYRSYLDHTVDADFVSVVLFNNTACVVFNHLPQAQAKEVPISFRGGGTHFQNGLDRCVECLTATNEGERPLLIFMSDGADAGESDGQGSARRVAETMRQSSVKSQHEFQLFTIAFGSGAQHSTLKQMADVAGGEFKDAPSGEDLQRVFEEIATSARAEANTMS